MHYEYRKTTFTGKYELTEAEALADRFPQTIERRQVTDWERLIPPYRP